MSFLLCMNSLSQLQTQQHKPQDPVSYLQAMQPETFLTIFALVGILGPGPTRSPSFSWEGQTGQSTRRLPRHAGPPAGLPCRAVVFCRSSTRRCPVWIAPALRAELARHSLWGVRVLDCVVNMQRHEAFGTKTRHLGEYTPVVAVRRPSSQGPRIRFSIYFHVSCTATKSFFSS